MKHFDQIKIRLFDVLYRNVFLIVILILKVNLISVGQTIYSGKVVDTYTKVPIAGAEICIQGSQIKATTDANGLFSLYTDSPSLDAGIDYDITIINGQLFWNSKKVVNITMTNILGQNNGFNRQLKTGTGNIRLPNLAEGIYFLSIISNDKKKICKLNSRLNSFHLTQGVTSLKKAKLTDLSSGSDTLIIIKSGYFSQKYAYSPGNFSYELLKLHYADIDYLEKLIRPEAFTMLQSLPLNPVFGEVKSIKIVYSILDQRIYYSNSEKYYIHYDFASQVLGYNKGQVIFNTEQYTKNPNRIYILASINHFISSDIYTLEFFAGDELDCTDIKTVYDKIVQTTFIGNKLKLYVNAPEWNCTNVPVISSDSLYKGQNYQPLNPHESFGYIKKITIDELRTTYLGRHDIVLLNGIPIDISVVSGIITTEFQTPLSHINVLSHNRGTPNMGLKDGWTNPKVNNFLDKLVYFRVTLDSFYIREANLTEAQTFWAAKEPHVPQVLHPDTLTQGLVDLTKVDVTAVKLVGGKAANIGELTKINVTGYGPLPLPEGIFAIPFYYYWEHIKKYGLDVYINNMLNDTLFWKDASIRQAKLIILQDSIKHSPIDTSFLKLVKDSLSLTPDFKTFRFRSSTNAEDISGFNGAGLYDSYTGSLDDPAKPVDKAIKKTWASLWNFQAFEEREYFKIDHRTVAMGILVNRSFPAEAANGVVITKNIFNPGNAAITINVQIGEISVVKPVESYLPDQIIYYTYKENTFEYISHSNVPGMEGKTVLTDNELKVLKDYCMAIYYHYCEINFECNPMDIEFKVDLVDGIRKIYIKQARLY